MKATGKGTGKNLETAYEIFNDSAEAAGGIKSKTEALFAVVQLAWESIGFDAVEEEACKNGTNVDKSPCNTYLHKEDWQGKSKCISLFQTKIGFCLSIVYTATVILKILFFR